MSDRKTAIWIVIVLTIVLAAAAGIFAVREPWTGISSDTPIAPLGTFRDLDACRVEVGKVGGWCGKSCRTYTPGQIADCAPLIKVERAP
jgi:hypothetical protein